MNQNRRRKTNESLMEHISGWQRSKFRSPVVVLALRQPSTKTSGREGYGYR